MEIEMNKFALAATILVPVALAGCFSSTEREVRTTAPAPIVVERTVVPAPVYVAPGSTVTTTTREIH
jgi:hypothetical protein